MRPVIFEATGADGVGTVEPAESLSLDSIKYYQGLANSDGENGDSASGVFSYWDMVQSLSDHAQLF